MRSGILGMVFCLTFRHDSVDRKGVAYPFCWRKNSWFQNTWCFLWMGGYVWLELETINYIMTCPTTSRKVGFLVYLDGSDSSSCLAFEDGETKWTSRLDNYLKYMGYRGKVKKRMVNDAYQKRANDFCKFGDLKRICFDVNIATSISKVYKLAFWC